MKEIRFHGRGGQGVVTAARVLATACVLEGKDVSVFPLFTPERRGSPVTAFARFDDKPVRESTQIYEPDCLVILDPRQASSAATFSGLKIGGIVALSSSQPMVERLHQNVVVIGFVDAMAIALKEIGRPIVNTCMLGSFAKTTGWVALDSILLSLKEYFTGRRLEQNSKCVQKGFERTEVIRFDGC